MALLQVVMNDQTNLFETKLPDREELLRDIFENSFLIEPGQLGLETGWGIFNTTYLTEEKDWIFGFLCKVLEEHNVDTLPLEANSLSEITNFKDRMVYCTPFFFNFTTQHIYTQSHWKVRKTSNSASEIWQKMLYIKLRPYIYDLDVQSIPEANSFYEKISKIKLMQQAEFDLFGPNILNDERIRSLITDFQPTGSRGLLILLKNYLQGLKTESEEFTNLIKYLLKGGGKGVFTGIDNKGASKVIKTESQPVEINVSKKLTKQSSDLEVKMVFDELNIEVKQNK